MHGPERQLQTSVANVTFLNPQYIQQASCCLAELRKSHLRSPARSPEPSMAIRLNRVQRNWCAFPAFQSFVTPWHHLNFRFQPQHGSVVSAMAAVVPTVPAMVPTVPAMMPSMMPAMVAVVAMSAIIVPTMSTVVTLSEADADSIRWLHVR